MRRNEESVNQLENLPAMHPKTGGSDARSPKIDTNWCQKSDRGKFPVVGILLYRKHVITEQHYIDRLIRYFETAGIIPLLSAGDVLYLTMPANRLDLLWRTPSELIKT
ncbi:MAG: hypothetical protein WBA89_22920 [Microcoleus sp.]|uniref:hypothetical protein n=1 Tax=Microcoleus sp. TaxID=44472 RepID=UPI003C74E228